MSTAVRARLSQLPRNEVLIRLRFHVRCLLSPITFTILNNQIVTEKHKKGTSFVEKKSSNKHDLLIFSISKI
jgi:hypothetical protein